MFQHQRALCCLLCALMGITTHRTFAFTSSFEPRNNMHITKSNHPTKLHMSPSLLTPLLPKKQRQLCKEMPMEMPSLLLLLLPEGLRGEVITVHDTNAADRPQPVLVKFGADDEERSDGYSLPSAFSMHLSANEIMVV
ncbi:hypothetical protein QTG54_002427, partial [Skeletonema marinoi]